MYAVFPASDIFEPTGSGRGDINFDKLILSLTTADLS